MRVRMLTFLIWGGTEAAPGDEIELPDADALAYIRTGQAEPVANTPPIEAATIAPPRDNMTKPHNPQLKRR